MWISVTHIDHKSPTRLPALLQVLLLLLLLQDFLPRCVIFQGKFSQDTHRVIDGHFAQIFRRITQVEEESAKPAD